MKIPKRLYHIAIIFLILLLVLIGRLAQIQLFDPLSFSRYQVNLIEESVKQRTHSIALDDGRGKMHDRYGEVLVEIHEPSVILFPFLLDEKEKLTEVARVLNLSTQQLENRLIDQKEPLVLNDDITTETVEQVNELNIPGAFGQMLSTDKDSEFAFHFIGTIGQNPERLEEQYPERIEKGLINRTTQIGVNGVQYAFDPFLVSEGESKLIYHVQQSGRPLFGLDVKYTAPANPFYPVALQTTIDRKAQAIMEKAIEDAGVKKGGAVLLDVQTSDVLAMVSRPLPPIENPLGKGSENQMVLPHIPGSVFKIVTAAAAIERNHLSVGRSFNCSQNTYNDGEESRDLGWLTFEESFYQSCNNTFATLLNEMIEKDPSVLDEFGAMLGVNDLSGWEGDVFHLQEFKHFPNERLNTFWGNETDKKVSRAVAQTAIGQLNVRLSPLSVANMMATIARGGKQKQVRAAHSVLYKNGNTLVDFENQEMTNEPLSRYTIKKLQALLEGVVSQPKGTGHYSLHDLPWAVAGKSGTAQKGKEGVYNKWFAGYFPADQPKYALVVVDLEASEAAPATNKAFANIVEELYRLQQQPDGMEIQ